ncbi:hypothetical protein FRC12_008640 [Ceratobasidium sp. 428]|nr:hypothetical protein FRC12_008640 [Ceratobasidium sp. 428]
MSDDGWVLVSIMPVLSERSPTDLTIFWSVCGSFKLPRVRPRLHIDRSAHQQTLTISRQRWYETARLVLLPGEKKEEGAKWDKWHTG